MRLGCPGAQGSLPSKLTSSSGTIFTTWALQGYTTRLTAPANNEGQRAGSEMTAIHQQIALIATRTGSVIGAW